MGHNTFDRIVPTNYTIYTQKQNIFSELKFVLQKMRNAR